MYIFYFSALAVSKPNDQMYPYDFRDAVKKKVTINTCNRFDCKTVDGEYFLSGDGIVRMNVSSGGRSVIGRI